MADDYDDGIGMTDAKREVIRSANRPQLQADLYEGLVGLYESEVGESERF